MPTKGMTQISSKQTILAVDDTPANIDVVKNINQAA